MSEEATNTNSHDDPVLLSPVEKAAFYIRDELKEDAHIADLGASSAGINLKLTDEARRDALEQLVPALTDMGFARTS